MIDEEIIEVVNALKAYDKTMKDNGISDNLYEKAVECIKFLQFENAELTIKNKVLVHDIENLIWREKATMEFARLESENAAMREKLEKMIELPCKIGDKFYVVNDCPPEIKEHECCAFTFAEDGQVLIIDGLDCHYSLKIVYLSKEDAKARLEELKGE